MKPPSPMEEVRLFAKIADIKDQLYTNQLLLTGLIELLIDQDIFTRQQLTEKIAQLESELNLTLEQQKQSEQTSL